MCADAASCYSENHHLGIFFHSEPQQDASQVNVTTANLNEEEEDDEDDDDSTEDDDSDDDSSNEDDDEGD
jgi:hypothetical protein